MHRLARLEPTPRAQRGTVTRGLMVLAVLVGAVMLQTGSLAWQSRLDAMVASLGLSSTSCRQPAVTASHGSPASDPGHVAGSSSAQAVAPLAAAVAPAAAPVKAVPAAPVMRGVAALPVHPGAAGASVASMASGVAAADAARGGNRSGGTGLAAPAGLSAPAI